jgi:hypothetical protein
MTEMMRLDIRFPIGGLFTVLGVLVAGSASRLAATPLSTNDPSS